MMRKKCLSVILCIALIILSISPVITVADASVWSGTLTEPEIINEVYQIASAENLAWFSNAVNTGSQTINGILTCDIQLNAYGSTSNEWIPIGNTTYPFKGSFDGDGHTVSGVYINSTEDYQGFFGYIALDTTSTDDGSTDYSVDVDTILHNTQCAVSNLTVINSSVTGNQNVGGLVGCCTEGQVKNCSFSGTVTGTANSVGGLVGWLASDSVIIECKTSGSVSGKQRVGALAGFANGNSITTKAYSDMTVSGTQNVGGVVGTLSAAYFEGCFFLGSVSGTDKVGGLVGYSAFGSMKSSYAIAPITSDGSKIGGAVGTNYGGSYNGIYYSYDISGVDGSIGIGRTVEEMKLSDFVKEVNSAKMFFCYDYTAINNGYPVLAWMLESDVWLGDLSVPQMNVSGTYLISKPSELAWFSALVNGNLIGCEATPDANAIVTDNLLFNIDASNDNFTRIEWTPIGTQSNPYTGTFNGNGYNIAGLYVTTDMNSGSDVGLFGYVGTGKISNAVVVDANISGITDVGGVAGYLVGGTVSNCYFSGTLSGDKAVGGIVGFASSNTSTVEKSCCIGTINGTSISGASYAQNVGGVVGYNNRATVNECFADAKINASASRYVGGVVGNNAAGTITNSYNTSSYIVGGITVGGIVGYNNNGTVNYCYTSGKVSGNNQCGIAFGTTSGSNVSNCYYDSSYFSIANTTAGATQKTPSDMTGSSAVEKTGLLSSEFTAVADDTYFYYYPQISSLYYSSITALKNASVDSVKRVQEKYVAKVQIDGRTDTYYETLAEAFSYASTAQSSITPVVYLVRDTALDETIDVNAQIGFFGTDGATLTRDESLTDAMFNVSGNTFTIGSQTYGEDTNDDFYIDGNDVAGKSSAITVQSGATLNIEKGVDFSNFLTIEDNVNPVTGAVIYNIGTVNISGGEFDNNICKSVGGVLYNYNDGIATINGGNFHDNEAKQGGAVYNYNAHTEITGGTFDTNCTGIYGGAVATNGIYAETYIGGAVVFNANTSENGGAVSTANYSTTQIYGGTFTNNQGYATGGAVYIGSGAELVLSGGNIKYNLAQKSSSTTQDGLGSGIYNGSTLTFKGSAQVHSSNDVYLASGYTISVEDRLSCSGNSATITPSSYTEGLKVLDGSLMQANYQKFALSNTDWHILATGTITSVTSQTVAIVSKTDAYSVEYVSLYDAFNSVASGEEANITLVADVTVTQTLPVNGNITLLCDDTTYTITCGSTFKGNMLNIASSATLNLGEITMTPNQQAQQNYNNSADNDGMVIIDCGGLGVSAVNVQSGGTFNMYDDSAIQNCSSTTSGAVVVTGTMNFYGGAIRNNSSTYGAIYVKSAGNLYLCGGIIYDNTSTRSGSAIYAFGNVTRRTQSYDYMYIESVYDSETGDLISTENPVYKCTVKTNSIIPETQDIYLAKNKILIDNQSTEFYIRSLNYLPSDTTFSYTKYLIDFAKYTDGSTVISGSNVADLYLYFTVEADGYYIKETGVLATNKIVAKSTASLTFDRNNKIIYGIDIDSATVGEVALLIANSRTNLKFLDSSGTELSNISPFTTGCKIQLLDSDKNVIDELTVVIVGDVNCDCRIDGMDSVIIRAIAEKMNGADSFTSVQKLASDFDGDGTITLSDADATDLYAVRG